MSATHGRSALASFRHTVTELIDEGAPFEDVEDAINSHPGLTEDQKAALWLFAFSLRDRTEQQRDARAHLTAVQVAAGEGEMTEQVREPNPGGAVEAALSERAGAEHYERYQRDARSGKEAVIRHRDGLIIERRQHVLPNVLADATGARPVAAGRVVAPSARSS